MTVLRAPIGAESVSLQVVAQQNAGFVARLFRCGER